MRTLMGLLLIACLGVTALAADRVQVVRLPDGALQPQVVADPQGVIHVVYLGGEPKEANVFYLRSSDEGATFSQPVRVNSEEKTAVGIGAIRGAQLAVSNGKVHVVWNARGGAKAPLLYARSDDGGKSFEPQKPISGDHPGMDGGGSIAADDSGNVLVAWHAPETEQEGEEHRRIWVRRSSDNGSTFAPEIAVDEPKRGVCACCSIRAAFIGSEPAVLYRIAEKTTNRSIVVVLINAKKSMVLGELKLGQCPMSMISVANMPGGAWMAWETKPNVQFAAIELNQSDGALSVPVKTVAGSNQKYPSLARASDGSLLIAWTEGSGWQKPGVLQWAVYGANGKPQAQSNPGDTKVPTWSFPAAFAKKDGSFVVLY